MPRGENPSGRVQIHPASFRYDSSTNSDTPKLRKPAGITAAVKPSSCFSSAFIPDPLPLQPSPSLTPSGWYPSFPSSFSALPLRPRRPPTLSSALVFHVCRLLSEFYVLSSSETRDQEDVGHFSRASNGLHSFVCVCSRLSLSGDSIWLWPKATYIVKRWGEKLVERCVFIFCDYFVLLSSQRSPRRSTVIALLLFHYYHSKMISNRFLMK